MVDWANTVIALAGVFLAIIALLQTRRSNRTADEANSISRAANDLSGNANRVAERALQLQEEEGKIRLVVKPRMLCVIGDGEDTSPRPVVEVVNLSAFPVTITKIFWKTADPDGKGFFWKNPTLSAPFGKFPARLPPREALTALGSPKCFGSLENLTSVTAAVACTACGEDVEGMTDQWKTEVARMVAEAQSTSAPQDVAGA